MKKTPQTVKLNRRQDLVLFSADGFHDCIQPMPLYASHGPFTCMQPKPAQNVIGQY